MSDAPDILSESRLSVTGLSNGESITPLLDKITTLVNAYLQTLERVGSEPVFSIRGLFVFYFQLLACEFGIILMLPIAMINSLVRLTAWYFGKKPTLIRNFGYELIRSTFRSLHRGEIPALELVKFRYLARGLLTLHVTRRLKKCVILVEQEEVFRSFQTDIVPKSLAELRLKLMKLQKLLKRTGQFRFVIFLSPIAGFISKFLGVDIPAFLLSQFKAAQHGIFSPSWLGHNQIRTEGIGATQPWLGLNLAIQILAGFAIAILSNFITKRQLLLTENIFCLEEAVFRNRPSLRIREMPVDLIGYSLLILLGSGLFYAAFSGGIKQDIMTGVIASSIYVLPFLYATYRRIRLGQW